MCDFVKNRDEHLTLFLPWRELSIGRFHRGLEGTDKYSTILCLHDQALFLSFLLWKRRKTFEWTPDRKNVSYSCSRDHPGFPARIMGLASTFVSLFPLSLSAYLVLLFQLTPFISPFLRIHADLLSMIRKIKIPKKDERQDGGKGIEGELLTTAGDNWQIPGMLAEITFDRPSPEKKRRALMSLVKKKFSRQCLNSNIFLQTLFIVRKQFLYCRINAI